MALDTETNRASLIPGMLPFPSATIDQAEQQGLIAFMFADPLSTIPVVWTIQADQASSWGDQSGVSSTWTIQPDDTSSWT